MSKNSETPPPGGQFLIYTASHQDLWNPSGANATMEKGFATPFTGKGLPGASVKKGVANPFSLLAQNP